MCFPINGMRGLHSVGRQIYDGFPSDPVGSSKLRLSKEGATWRTPNGLHKPRPIAQLHCFPRSHWKTSIDSNLSNSPAINFRIEAFAIRFTVASSTKSIAIAHQVILTPFWHSRLIQTLEVCSSDGSSSPSIVLK